MALFPKITLDSHAVSNEEIYYLNQPESVSREGIIGSGTILASHHTRIFFHFVNRTKSTNIFSLSASSSVKNLRVAFAKAADPQQAGLIAIKNFLNTKTSGKPMELSVGESLKPGITISGVIDCEGIQNTDFICKLGDGKVLSNTKVRTIPMINIDHNMVMGNQDMVKYRIGDKDDDMSIPGGYGVSYRWTFTPKSTKTKFVVSISPRGGDLRFPYSIDSTTIVSPTILAKHDYTLFSKTVIVGEKISFETIPVGGYCYPVEIKIKAYEVKGAPTVESLDLPFQRT